MGPQEHKVERRLAAIFAADVAGYSRLMEQDEVGTLRTLTAYREIMDRLIVEHGGRIANTAGDSVLAEFPSAVDAVRCAVTVQAELAQDGGDVPFDRRFQFRIGVHVGDVMVRANDLLGDGVNIAARLESLAEPGGVCISEAVHGYVRKALPLGFTNLGLQHVKNIEEPLLIYALQVASPTSGSIGHAKAPPLPDKPSIAVLPFTNMSSDPQQEYFADGMTEDIITGLSRLKWLFVIARNSTFTYKGQAVDVRQVASDLGVRYVLQGSVRTAGNRIRVTGQLIEAETGKHFWAEKYDRQVSDIFVLQDELTDSVLAAIEPHLYAEEGFRATAQPPEKVSTWGLVVRAIGLIGRVGHRENEEARALLQEAINSEPSYARGHAILSWATWWAAENYWLPDETIGKAEAQRYAEVALALDPAEPWARMMLGLSLGTDATGPQFNRALKEFEAAIHINPSFALAHSMYGWVLVNAGRFETAEQETRTALRLSPKDSFASLYELVRGLTLLTNRQYEEAYAHLQRALVAFPEIPQHHTLLICCCGYLGLKEEAMMLMSRRNRLPGAPRLTVSLVREQLRNYRCIEILTEGLAKAGVPES